MKVLRISSIALATMMMSIVPFGNILSAKAHAPLQVEQSSSLRSLVLSAEDGNSSPHAPLPEEKATVETPIKADAKEDLVDGNLPGPAKPADVILESLRDVPVGTPLEEIKLASEVFSVDFSFMRTVAKIESDFNPRQRTGSYVGLFQLSKGEFSKYGSGEITNSRDNAIAAAYKFATERHFLNRIPVGNRPSATFISFINKAREGQQNTLVSQTGLPGNPCVRLKRVEKRAKSGASGPFG